MFVCLPAPLLAPGADCNEHPTPTLEDSQILLPTQHRGDGSTVGMDSDRIVSNKTPTTGPRVRTRPKRASTRLANVMGINSSRVVRKRGIEYQTTYCFSEASPSCKLHAIESLFCASIPKLYSNYLFPQSRVLTQPLSSGHPPPVHLPPDAAGAGRPASWVIELALLLPPR
jgi:hypothetical protein